MTSLPTYSTNIRAVSLLVWGLWDLERFGNLIDIVRIPEREIRFLLDLKLSISHSALCFVLVRVGFVYFLIFFPHAYVMNK